MSGFEVAGIILGAYPLLMAALAVYSETKSGKGARRLVRTLKTEETIFNNFIHHILSPPTISEAEFVRLTDPARPDLDLWKDTTLETKLGRRLGGNTAEIVVQILREINDLLRSLRNELTSSDRGMVRTMPAIKGSSQLPPADNVACRTFCDDFVRVFGTRGTAYPTPASKSISSD